MRPAGQALPWVWANYETEAYELFKWPQICFQLMFALGFSWHCNKACSKGSGHSAEQWSPWQRSGPQPLCRPQHEGSTPTNHPARGLAQAHRANRSNKRHTGDPLRKKRSSRPPPESTLQSWSHSFQRCWQSRHIGGRAAQLHRGSKSSLKKQMEKENNAVLASWFTFCSLTPFPPNCKI